MEEVEKIVIEAMDESAEEHAETEGSESGEGEKSGGEKKKVKKGEWFKRVVSALLALVTIMGALVAWRANVAASDSGDNDSSGLLALQNSEAARAVSDIQANGGEMGYVNYLRDRIIASDMLTDNTVANSPADMQDYMARQITETLDLGNTSKYYFFPGNYLEPGGQSILDFPNYEADRQANEAYAKAQESQDLNYQQHFDTSDALSNKSMFLLAMLIVLAISLWLLALSEVISNAVKYATALGGVLYMILGGVGAYLVDSGQASQDSVSYYMWPAVWVAAGLTLLAVLVIWVLPLLRGRQPSPAVASTLAVPPAPPAYPPPPPQNQPYQQQPPYQQNQPYPQQPQYPPYPSYPPPGYPPAGNLQPPAPGAPQYGPPPPNYPQPQPQPQPHQPAHPAQQAPSGATSTNIKSNKAPTRSTSSSAKKAEEKEEEAEEEKPFNRIVTVLIATVALIAALLAYAQSDASNNSSSANRNSQQYATQALGAQTYGASEMNYQNEVLLQNWKRLQILNYSATNHGDAAAAKRYQHAMDQISQLSDIFSAKYFDPKTQDLPNDSAFAADLYSTKAYALSERSVIQRDLHNVWDSKASTYIVHLTLLAVALALLGLSLATSSFVRFIFAGSGTLLVVATVIWAGAIYTEPVKSINDQAVDSYAKGLGLQQAGKYNDAITAFTDALGLQPGYANAMYQRGETYLQQALAAYTDSFYQTEAKQTDDAQKNTALYNSGLEAAATDFQAAQAAGRDDTFVGWELGWADYLLGKFDDAVQVDRHVLSLDPNATPVRLNLAIALVAQGNDDAAELEYNTSIARTSDHINNARDNGQTVSSDFWYYLDASASDLFNLVLRTEKYDYAYLQAPPHDKIANPDDAAQEAFNMMTKLRNKTAAFEYLAKNGQMPPDIQVTTKVDSPVFKAIEAGQSGEIEGSAFPDTTKYVTMYFNYENIPKGHSVAFKVYQNYNHVPEYDKGTDNWQDPESGAGHAAVTDPFESISEAYSMPAGLWTVEMYVDNQMVQIGVFYIENADETQQSQSQPTGSPTPTP